MILLLSDIKAGVKAISSKVALKGEGDMTHAAILEDDTTLKVYFTEAMSVLQGVLGRFCSDVTPSDTSYTFTLDEPPTWSSTEERVLALAKSFAINYVCACWFEAVKPELEERYRNLHQQQEAKIFKELILRAKPTRS